MKKVGIKAVICLIVSLFLLGGQGEAFAEEGSRWKVGIQGGISFANEDESFGQYDLVADYNLPWEWRLGKSSYLGTKLTGAVGVLHGGGDTGAIGSLGLALALGWDDFPLEIRLGSATTLMSEDKYGDEDFGGIFQFTSHLGLEWRFNKSWSASARYQHMSNLNIYSRNPGLNMVMMGVSYHF